MEHLFTATGQLRSRRAAKQLEYAGIEEMCGLPDKNDRSRHKLQERADQLIKDIKLPFDDSGPVRTLCAGTEASSPESKCDDGDP